MQGITNTQLSPTSRSNQIYSSLLLLPQRFTVAWLGRMGRCRWRKIHALAGLDDDSMVHLGAYQPQHEPSNQYCTEIPREGNTLLVIDLADQALRDIPVGIRVVRNQRG